ncbi:MAG: DUF59 domain-containing protein [Acidobacteria bacterium]|nr:DUF59 domain-containing protein [Acidobacteriota bacterium]
MTAEEKEALHGRIVEALQSCYDPEIPVDIYKLGLIYEIDIAEDGAVKITMTLTSPNCPAAQSLPDDVRIKAQAVEGVKSVEVEIVFEPPWTPEKMDDAAKLVLNIL